MSNSLMLCLLNTLCMVGGQLLFKAGASGKDINSIKDIVLLLFTPLVLCGICLYAGTTCLWLYILSKTPISQAYPIQALAFPIVTVLSTFLFHESVTPMRIVGVLIIVAGVTIATHG